MIDIEVRNVNGLKRQREDDGNAAKRPRTASEEEEEDEELHRVFNELQALQQKIHEVDSWEVKEVLRLSQLAAQQKQPFFQQRADLVSRIDNFWKNALINSRLRDHISEADRNVLEYLESLDVSLPDVNGMYTISLTFDESNPVFKTTTLVRTVEKNPHDEGNSSVCAPFEFKQEFQDDPDFAERIEEFSFLSWFWSNMDYNPPGDEIAEEIRSNVWTHPAGFDEMEEDLDVELEETANPENEFALELDDYGDREGNEDEEGPLSGANDEEAYGGEGDDDQDEGEEALGELPAGGHSHEGEDDEEEEEEEDADDVDAL